MHKLTVRCRPLIDFFQKILYRVLFIKKIFIEGLKLPRLYCTPIMPKNTGTNILCKVLRLKALLSITTIYIYIFIHFTTTTV